ncbi:MAG: hypothetical protein JNM30_08620 [Rhodospirillales bacterium]|nr:hypothetical protein [Rhodospirillales bacterium]
MNRMRIARLFALLMLAAIGAVPAAGSQEPAPIAIHLFWSEGCPHCARARAFLEALDRTEDGVDLRTYEVSNEPGNAVLFARLNDALSVDVPAVPLVIAGDRAFIGYLDDQSTGLAIREAALACRAAGCVDIVASFQRALAASGGETTETRSPARRDAPPLPPTIRLPVFGEVATASLSLPLLTVLLAVIDGFNPCAMWVLLFLIGMLLGMTDHVRMWVLGAAFLLASAAVYFLFLAAWLNVLVLLGTLAWIRIALGIGALAAGSWYLSQYVRNPAALCRIAPAGQRQRIMERIRGAVREQSFLLAVLGMVAVAAAVNLVELLCSAGVPAIYTQVLALSALPASQHYLYLLLYVLVFLLDDLAVFVTAMVTLQASGLTAQYARYSHLLGGIVLAVLGMLLIFRPDWLKFGA